MKNILQEEIRRMEGRDEASRGRSGKKGAWKLSILYCRLET